MTIDTQEVLIKFLKSALAIRQQRLIEFASKPKTRKKFIFELHHQFGDYLSESVVVESLSDSAWSLPALAFAAPDVFGTSFDSLRAAHVEHPSSSLLVASNGIYGIWCDETYADSTRFIRVPPAQK